MDRNYGKQFFQVFVLGHSIEARSSLQMTLNLVSRIEQFSEKPLKHLTGGNPA